MSRGTLSRRVFACSLLGLAFLFACAPRASGDLSLSRAVWDFGSIERGEVKDQKIVITNSGDQAVKVEKVELPEGLSVTPSLDDAEIGPQQELEVEFRFDSAGTLGKIQQYAYIFPPESEGKDILTLTIKGEVSEKSEPRLRVTPASWDFRTLTTGEQRKGKFTCENVGTADLKVEEILLYDRRFNIDKSRIAELTGKPLQPGDKFDFEVEVNADYPGKYDIDFYIKSNSVGSNFTKVGIEGYVVSKTRGVVISSDLLSVTNNTTYTAEVTRTGKEGKTDELTVERDKVKYFPRDATTPPTPFNPTDYTLTVKLVRPAPRAAPPAPTPQKPTEEKPEEPGAEEKPGEESPETTAPPPALPEVKPAKPEVPETPEEAKPVVPKPGEGEPAKGEGPSAEKPPEAQPEKTEPSGEPKPAEGEKPTPPESEKKPEGPAEEQKPGPPESEKKVEGTPPETPAAPKEGETPKPAEGEATAPPAEPEKPSSPEAPPKDEETKPPGSE